MYPPHAVGITASLFERAGWDVECIDCTSLNTIDAISQILQTETKHLIGIGTSPASYHNDISFVIKLRESIGDIDIFSFGKGLGFLEKQFDLNQSVYQYTAFDFPPKSALPRFSNSELLVPERTHFMGAVNDWDHLDISEYSFLSVEASTGCYYNCNWCPYPITQGKKVHCKDLSTIRDELLYIVQFASPKSTIQFRDPLFPGSKERVYPVLEIIKSCIPPSFRVGIETRLEFLNEEVISFASSANITNINLGIEFGDPKLLSDMKPGIGSVKSALAYLEKTRNISELCLQYGIQPFVMFMLGIPGESIASLNNTIKFAQSLPDGVAIQASFFIPIPGTQIFNDLGLLGEQAIDSILKGHLKAGELLSAITEIPANLLNDAKELVQRL